MGKHKLARWAELGTFSNVIQADEITEPGTPHPIKGHWRERIFKNSNPLVVEFGCGKGEYTIGLAIKHPEMNFIGVDIKGARMWRGAKTSSDYSILNTAFLRTRIEFIDSFFAEDEIDEIWITFPDPHPGKKNSNKRLTCPWFLNKYTKVLKNNGIIHLKTDNIDLYNYTCRTAERNQLEVLASTPDLYGGSIANDILSIKTHYEKLFLKDGLKISYLAFRLKKDQEISDDWPSKNK